MIPILYDYTETEFRSNGIGRLVDCIRCTVTEERNGPYECEFVYPITGRHYQDISEGRIIVCTHDDDGDVQPFIIYRRSAPMDGQVTFNARHLSYRLSNVIVDPYTADNVSDALAGLTTHAIGTNPFTFWTDKSTLADFSVAVPSSVRSLLGGVEGSLLDVYGGEWEFDKWTVKLHGSRGVNRGVTIRYGKNLSDLNQTIDAGSLYNAIVPYWASEVDGVQTLVTLPEKIVSAAGVTDPKPVVMDLSTEFPEEPTEAQLRTFAQQYLEDYKPWIPSENIVVDFIQLWQTTEYASVANLQKVRLCDTVDVLYPALGVTARGIKVIKTVYNVLADRYDQMELGQPQVTFGETLTADIDKEVRKATAGVQTMLDAAISTATDLITGGKGGHLVIGRDVNGRPNELLIMDTDSILTATNILRINMSGIGFSTNGGATYSTAWTLDGRFVADFITTGTLRAIMIQGPNEGTFWNLTSGEWQSHDVKTVTGKIQTGPASYVPVTYLVDLDLNINDGVLSVVGTHDDLEETVYAQFGLAVEVMNYDYYYYDEQGLDWESGGYVCAGLELRGDKIKGYAGEDEGWQVDVSKKAYYRPYGRYAPDQILLGGTDSVTPDTGVVFDGFEVPNRNELVLTGGWTDPDDAIVFRRYYRSEYDENEDALWETYYGMEGSADDPDPTYEEYRPAWPYKPGDWTDKTGTGDTYKIVCPGYLTDSKGSIYFTVPLDRPVSEYVTSIRLVSASCKIRQGGSYILGDSGSTVNIAGSSYAKVIRKSAHGLTIRLKKSSGSFSGTNNDLVMVDLLGLQFEFS